MIRAANRKQGWPLVQLAFLLFGVAGLFSSANGSAPSFTGVSLLTPQTGGVVNLRSQGIITGSASMRVEAVSILPLGLGVRVNVVEGVCIQISNALGLDLLSLGAMVNILVTNADAPRGVRGTVLVLPGIANNNDLGSCSDASRSPIANAGTDRTIADADGAAGELVALDASASIDPDGSIVSYLWTDLSTNQILGNTAVLQARLGDGGHQIRLTVVDNSGGPTGTASSIVNIVVQAAAAAGPTPNPGADRSVLDSDGLVGELVTLDASASINVNGSIVSYEWLDSQQNLLGVGISLNVRLPDGVNLITLRVTGSNQLTSLASVSVTVGAPAGSLVEALVNLSPLQRSVASTLDDLCERLETLSLAQTLDATQIDLLNRCNGLAATVDPQAQTVALDELGARELTILRAQTLLFSSTQNTGILSRLATLRSGAKGLSLSGLSVRAGDQMVPIDQLQAAAKKVWEILGGGASADEPPGGLLSDRFGFWLRGNYDRGTKIESAANQGFKGEQWGLTGGADYRFARESVVGMAVGYGKSDIDYRPLDGGGLATKAWTVSLYGSAYPAGNLFVDAVFNYGSAAYDSTRRIVYAEGGNLIDRTAFGQTEGTTLSGGASLGYDWSRKGFTVSPALGYFISVASVDAFSESGAQGLDLTYGKQDYRSSTATASLAVNYAWSTPWFVLLPHVRGEYLHEMNDDVEFFNVRFAHDPFADAANPTPLVVVRSDTPDQWYWRFAAGLSAQFKYGLSGFIEYQRLEDFEFVDFENTTIGLRLQRAF